MAGLDLVKCLLFRRLSHATHKHTRCSAVSSQSRAEATWSWLQLRTSALGREPSMRRKRESTPNENAHLAIPF